MAIFDQDHPKIFESTFSFPEFVKTSCKKCKKSVYSICSFFRYSQFQSLVTRLATPIFDHAHFSNFRSPFNLHKLVPACKNQLIPSVISWDKVNFRVQRPDLPHPFWPCPTKKCSNNFCFINLFWDILFIRDPENLFKNIAIWLAESMLAYISGKNIFPNIAFAQKHSK